jgi:hypothetical protein
MAGHREVMNSATENKLPKFRPQGIGAGEGETAG